jgi:DNA-binding NtrC family response regulator
MNTQKPKILVIDDDALIRASIQAILTRKNCSVAGAKSATEARELLDPQKKGGYALIILDIKLGEESGLELLADMRANGITVPVLMVSGLSDMEKIQQAAAYSIKGFLVKPFNAQTLYEKVAACLPELAA